MNILLVDDEYISNFINKRLIQNINASILTTEFNDPEEAFNKLRSMQPDLIFLDINMPVMNGWDFLNKMAEEKIDYKVVILTSSINIIDRKMASSYGNVIGYVEKPATSENLIPYINTLPTAKA